MLFSLIFYHNARARTRLERIAAIGVFARVERGAVFRAGSILVPSRQLSGLEETKTHRRPGAVPMNFVEKLNVVAAYAAFAFVCAIIFGMV